MKPFKMSFRSSRKIFCFTINIFQLSGNSARNYIAVVLVNHLNIDIKVLNIDTSSSTIYLQQSANSKNTCRVAYKIFGFVHI